MPFHLSAVVWITANQIREGKHTTAHAFCFQNIRLTGVTPRQGPRSGGTQLTIKGSHLNIGSSVRVLLRNYPCHVNTSHSSSSRITCTTSEALANETVERITLSIDDATRVLTVDSEEELDEGETVERITLSIDDARRILTLGTEEQPSDRRGRVRALFHYMNDPTIIEIKPLKSFASGGRMITVHGTNIHAVQSPEMVVYRGDGVNQVIMNRTVRKGFLNYYFLPDSL